MFLIVSGVVLNLANCDRFSFVREEGKTFSSEDRRSDKYRLKVKYPNEKNNYISKDEFTFEEVEKFLRYVPLARPDMVVDIRNMDDIIREIEREEKMAENYKENRG